MLYNPTIHHRRSIRLRDYDYSDVGWYFVTICIEKRDRLFGEIIDGQMVLNDAGRMVDYYWTKLKDKFPCVVLDEYIVMPNHFHGIVSIVGAPLVGALDLELKRAGTRPAPTLGEIIGTYKSLTTNAYISGIKSQNWTTFNKRLWQRNYYEHIIRDEFALNNIRQYIVDNPKNWEIDEWF